MNLVYEYHFSSLYDPDFLFQCTTRKIIHPWSRLSTGDKVLDNKLVAGHGNRVIPYLNRWLQRDWVYSSFYFKSCEAMPLLYGLTYCIDLQSWLLKIQTVVDVVSLWELDDFTAPRKTERSIHTAELGYKYIMRN